MIRGLVQIFSYNIGQPRNWYTRIVILVGKIDGSPTTFGGFLDDFQRRYLSNVLLKENKTGRRVGVLGLRTYIL